MEAPKTSYLNIQTHQVVLLCFVKTTKTVAPSAARKSSKTQPFAINKTTASYSTNLLTCTWVAARPKSSKQMQVHLYSRTTRSQQTWARWVFLRSQTAAPTQQPSWTVLRCLEASIRLTRAESTTSSRQWFCQTCITYQTTSIWMRKKQWRSLKKSRRLKSFLRKLRLWFLRWAALKIKTTFTCKKPSATATILICDVARELPHNCPMISKMPTGRQVCIQSQIKHRKQVPSNSVKALTELSSHKILPPPQIITHKWRKEAVN